MDFKQEEVLQPFHMEIVPITKVMLINFVRQPENIYKALELQYLETENEGIGYRVIAYRNDDYVDVYDEESLQIKEVGNFEVCGKGLKHYRNQTFKDTYLEHNREGLQVGFGLQDYKGRTIKVIIKEQSKRKSRPFDMVAPVGASSENPTSFPAFPMYQFDFVRKKNTLCKVQIDGKDMILDPFPVPIPKDGQMRLFVRYSCDCELVDFAKNKESILKPQLCEQGIVLAEGLKAQYKEIDGEKRLETLQFIQSKHYFAVKFEALFPDLLRMGDEQVNGCFKIEMEPSMGYFAGQYSVKKQGSEVKVMMIPSEGWNAKATAFLTKMMFQKQSIFCSWPKKYCYEQTIDLETGKSVCHWKQLDYKKLDKDWCKV